MKKKIIIIVSIMAFIAMIGYGFVYFNKSNCVSRYQWINMLCDKMGIEDAIVWGIVDSEADMADEYVNGEYIAVTSMKSLDNSKLGFYTDFKDIDNDKELLEIAISNGIVDKWKKKKYYTFKECTETLEKLEQFYYTHLWQDNICDLEYSSSVIEINKEDILLCDETGTRIKLKKDNYNLQKNSIVVFDMGNSGIKTAGRIKSIDSSGNVLVEGVEINEVIKHLNFSGIKEITFETIENYYGNNNISENYNVGAVPMSYYSIQKNNKGFKLEIKTDNNKLNVIAMDNSTGKTLSIPTNIKVDDDFEISAEIDINKINAGVQIRYENGTLEYADVAIDSNTSLEGHVNCKKQKKIKLFELPVPIGNGIAGVKVVFYLDISADGELSLKCEMPASGDVRYVNDKGFSCIKRDMQVNKPQIEVHGNTEMYIDIEPTIFILFKIELLEAHLKTGINVDAKAINRSNGMVCINANVSCPIIYISVGTSNSSKSPLKNIQKKKEWEIMTSDSALYKLKLHYEKYSAEKGKFVDECTYKQEYNENNTENTNNTNNTENTEIKDNKDISSLYGYNLPVSFQFSKVNDAFEIKDMNDYYLVKGSIIVGECVSIDKVSGKIGESFDTGCGKKYTVVGQERYNNDQRSRILLNDDQGNAFEIVNWPAHYADVYTHTLYYMITSDTKNYRTVIENVNLKIDYNTIMPSGETFEQEYKNGAYSEWPHNIAYDIHFDESGRVEFMAVSDIYSNGNWGGASTVDWRK